MHIYIYIYTYTLQNEREDREIDPPRQWSLPQSDWIDFGSQVLEEPVCSLAAGRSHSAGAPEL